MFPSCRNQPIDLANQLASFFMKRTLVVNPSRHDPGRRKKINLDFYFQTSLWCLKRFYEGLKENKNLKLTLILKLSEMHGAGRMKGSIFRSKMFYVHLQCSIK